MSDNPKEEAGAKKAPIHLVPPRVTMAISWVLGHGAKKYGPYNFRKAGVRFSTYFASTYRHMTAWFEGEDMDPESTLHHIDHAIAGLYVLRDSMLEGNAIDDRPIIKEKKHVETN